MESYAVKEVTRTARKKVGGFLITKMDSYGIKVVTRTESMKMTGFGILKMEKSGWQRREHIKTERRLVTD